MAEYSSNMCPWVAMASMKSKLDSTARARTHRDVPTLGDQAIHGLIQVIDEECQVVQPAFVGAESLADDACRHAVVLHELDHDRAPLPVGGTVIEPAGSPRYTTSSSSMCSRMKNGPAPHSTAHCRPPRVRRKRHRRSGREIRGGWRRRTSCDTHHCVMPSDFAREALSW